MSADNRSITTDALAVLGTLIDETVGRDAIHLAVEPMVSSNYHLKPGDRITLINGEAVPDRINALGIVDPFLTATVEPGQRFLMVLLPRQIATLRHVWDHPAFPPSQSVGVDLGVAPAANPMMADHEIGKRWLTEHATSAGMTFEQLVKDMMDWSRYDSEPYWLDTSEDPDPLWDMMDKLLGFKIDRGEIDLSCRGC